MRAGRTGQVALQSAPTTITHSDTMTMNNAQKALNWAMTNADVDAMLEILSSSAEVDVDERDRACGMQTVLMRLCHLRITENQRCAVLRLLLSKDPDVNVKDGSGRTALVHACIAERADVVEYLSQVPHCDPAARDNDGNTPLLHAVRTRRLAFVQTLLRCFYDRLDVNARNNKGATALAEAESRQDHDICRALVTEGGALPFPSNPMPSSTRQTPRSSRSDFGLVTSPNLSSRASSTPRRRLEALPPTVLPYRQRGAAPDDLLSPRSARPPAGPSLLGVDSLSDTSSTVLLSLPEEGGRSPAMPRRNARKKESASELNGQTSSRGQQARRKKADKPQPHPDTLPSIHDAHSRQQLTANCGRTSGVVDDVPTLSARPADEGSSIPSRESSPVSLPRLPEVPTTTTNTTTEPKLDSDKPPRRRNRKNSASLPNLTNAGPAFLVSPHYGQSSSSDNIAGVAAAAAAAESRALDWERGVRTSYRKENPDFKLPQLNVTLNGSLTATDWCPRCGRTAGMCGCGGGGVVGEVGESRVESSRLSSKGKSRNSGGNGGIERMLYLSGDSRLTAVRPSRTFTSGD